MKRVVIAVFSFILLSSFMTTKKLISTELLYDTKWLLSKLSLGDSLQPVTTKAFIKFDQAKQSVGGNGSCNVYGGHVELVGDSIHISNIFSTKMYCDAVQSIENSFLQSLSKVNRYELKENTLTLLSNEKVLLIFEKENDS